MRKNIGKRFRVRYGEYISKLNYEIVAFENDTYIIGFNNNKKDQPFIKGWPQKNGKYGNKYRLFWIIGKNDLIKENNNYLDIE